MLSFTTLPFALNKFLQWHAVRARPQTCNTYGLLANSDNCSRHIAPFMRRYPTPVASTQPSASLRGSHTSSKMWNIPWQRKHCERRPRLLGSDWVCEPDPRSYTADPCRQTRALASVLYPYAASALIPSPPRPSLLELVGSRYNTMP